MSADSYQAPSQPPPVDPDVTPNRSRQRAQRTYSIGHVARILCVSPQTLRYYEREGMIIPIRTAGGTRRFVSDDLRRLHKIRELIVDEGLNVAGIRHMLGMLPCWDIRRCTSDQRARCWQLSEDGSPCWMTGHCVFQEDLTSCRSCVVYARAFELLSKRRVLRVLRRSARRSVH
jgi:MerR family transcriptional regulator/heat shock protein HspR